MNIVYCLIMSASLLLLIFTEPDAFLNGMLGGAANALTMTLTMISIYVVWMGLLEVMDRSGVSKWIGKALRPLTDKMFKGEPEEVKDSIAMNMSANLLGMGGAATPLGIKAVEGMVKDNKTSDNIALFVVINCTSIQLIPTTIIGLRASAGSAAPSDIILPSLIATTVSTVVGVAMCYAIKKIKSVCKDRKLLKSKIVK